MDSFQWPQLAGELDGLLEKDLRNWVMGEQSDCRMKDLAELVLGDEEWIIGRWNFRGIWGRR